jgi:hypothetical protein
MMGAVDERERRLAQNEALFREVNERIDDLGDGSGDGGRLFEYLCECSDGACTLHVELAAGEYDSVRADPVQFVVLPDHHMPAVEAVVARNDRYWVVKKLGEAGDYAEALDPRSR